jgi:hypothetical protein
VTQGVSRWTLAGLETTIHEITSEETPITADEMTQLVGT